MRVVTVNLYNGRVVPADLQRFLDEFEPDILCGQEVGPEAARVLDAHFAHGRLEPGLDFRGKAMVAQMPITPVSIELAWRGGFRSVVSVDGREIDIVSAHLANPIDGSTGVPVRRRQLDALEPVLTSIEAGVVVGDMNATPVWPAYRRVRRWFDDGVADWARRTGRRPARTWAPYPDWPALLRIDHVFTRGVELADVQVVPIAGLDHRAVVADVSMSGGGWQ